VNSPVDGLPRSILDWQTVKWQHLYHETTIDKAARLVIPKDIRRKSGIKPGMPLDVRWENGTITIAPTPLPVKLERKGRLLVAVPTKDTPRLSADTVERTRKRLRRERSVASS
jgi:AbrB family looped-hinge helix DNA binding protein